MKPLLLSVFLSLSAISAHAPSEVPSSLWEPEKGDVLVIDTEENLGYLIHKNEEYMSFPLVTGQRRVVTYIGLTYNAATPEGEWLIQSKNIQGDRITYGPEGEFLRMYEDGQWTHYGVHTHAHIQTMLESNSQFRSMGCVIVTKPILDIIEITYNKNKHEGLKVVTKRGVGKKELIAMVR